MTMTTRTILRSGVLALGAAAVVAGTVLVGTAAAPVAPAQRVSQTFNDGPAPDGRRGPPLRMLAVALDLTDAQQDQIKAIFEGHRPEFEQLKTRARTAQTAVRTAIEADEVNEQAIRSAVTARAQVEADGAVLKAKMRKEVQALLTPEQRTKADALRKALPSRFGPRMSPLGGL